MDTLPPLERLIQERDEMKRQITELCEYKAELEECLAKARERLLEQQNEIAALRQPKYIRRWAGWKE